MLELGDALPLVLAAALALVEREYLVDYQGIE
jgi:hypothetical protein